ncbi:MAG: hypothetical protein IJP68_07815 [Selenomonadaceae bacterium]|nr:hypothetical protein [Selenomonadaceae bacterium]
MNKYIIEIDGKKIFTYEAEGEDKNFRCRLMRPHGDKFHSAKKIWSYWTWFEAETAIEEPHIFFICSPENLTTLEKLKSAAPKFHCVEDTTWQMSELKKILAEQRGEPPEPPPVEETPPPRKFRVKVYAPLAEQENLDVEQKKSEPEEIPKPEDIPDLSELPDELREKISAEDLQSYIEEQTDGQCDGVSFKKTSP